MWRLFWALVGFNLGDILLTAQEWHRWGPSVEANPLLHSLTAVVMLKVLFLTMLGVAMLRTRRFLAGALPALTVLFAMLNVWHGVFLR
jgi:hypothetical protein